MKYFLSIVTLFIASAVLGQDKLQDSSVNYMANWGKSASKIFYIVHSKESYESGELKSESNFSYEAHVTVLDSTENSYTVQWIFRLPAKVKETNPKLADSFPVFEGMKMIVKTSETGEFKELINWQEVRDAYIKMTENALPQKRDSSAQTALEQSKELFNPKEMGESALIKEIRLFYLPYGYKFTTNEIKETTQMPNPFASEPLPAFETYKITELNSSQNYFTLAITQDIDKSGAQKLFEGFLEKSNMDKDEATSEASKMPENFDIKDYSEYKFIPSIGWPQRINYKRTVKNGQITRTDSYSIEMKE